MVAATLPSKLGGLARMLVQEKLLTEDEAAAIQALANSQRLPFVSQLVQSKKLSAMKVAETAASAFGFPLFDLNGLNSDYLSSKTIDAKVMQANRVMALQSRGNTLFVALSDPTNRVRQRHKQRIATTLQCHHTIGLHYLGVYGF